MWMTIDKLHEHVKGREMFVVRAFDVNVHGGSDGYTYITDPYCVWYEPATSHRTDKFVRWPHNFPPTHFCLLPRERE
jgi:hypothetical protein